MQAAPCIRSCLRLSIPYPRSGRAGASARADFRDQALSPAAVDNSSLSRRKALIGASAVAALSGVPGAMATDAKTLISETPSIKLYNGLSMPAVGLGTSGLSGEACTKAVQTALRMGFRHIDSAQMYGNEEACGKGLASELSNGIKREDVFVVTKLDNKSHAPEVVEPAVRDSLKRLQLDYVDALLIHWPMNPEIVKETWKAMESTVDKGLVKSIGISNFSSKKTDEWFGDARIQPAINQVEVHPHWRNDALLAHAKKHNIAVMAYAPMSSPATMGKQGRKVPNLLEDPGVHKIAEKLGKTPAQVLLSWGIQHGSAVIPRSGSETHQRDILATVEFELPAEDYKTLSNLDYQLKYFSGDGLAIGEGKPYSSYQELWDEEPTQKQIEFDYS